MKNWIITKWNSFDTCKRLWVTLFIQIWVWPQLFYVGMPPNIAFPLGTTAWVGVAYNVIILILALEKRRDDQYWKNRQR
jgi:hypothetical protein